MNDNVARNILTALQNIAVNLEEINTHLGAIENNLKK